MTSSPDRIRERLKRAISPRLPERYRRDDSGLTTLEWLLIVAAVAGLAALAVVLVTNVVGDTSEQISGSSARLTAAHVAARSIQEDRISDEIDNDNDANDRCRRLEIIYSDIDGLSATPAGSGTGFTCTILPAL